MRVMESHDYRLERWLAVLLSLLFFLPFVARADDIALSNYTYHPEELPYRDGAAFLALTERGVLVPVTIAVTVAEDIGDEAGKPTARRVAVAGMDDVFLLRSPRLQPGKVVPADPGFSDLMPAQWNASFTLHASTYELSYRCDGAQCTLLLAGGGVSQDLMSFPIERVGTKIGTLGVQHFVNFAGDLDRDGKLDLIANVPTHWNEARPTLFLSTAAGAGQLVGKAAEISMSGC
jgi:hypothetical protein